MLAALSFLDLPFKAVKFNYIKLSDIKLKIEATSNSLVFYKEIKEGVSRFRYSQYFI